MLGFNRDMKKLILIAALAAAVPGTAFAASGNTDTKSGSATATVVSPLVLTHTPTAAIAFGSFTAGTAGGTVVVTSGGSGSVTGDVAFVPGSTNAADAFTVTGDASRTFSITTGAGSVTSGTNSMSFTTSASAASGTLNTSGAATFTVGGTLTVPSTAVAGSYTGTYSATVTYN